MRGGLEKPMPKPCDFHARGQQRQADRYRLPNARSPSNPWLAEQREPNESARWQIGIARSHKALRSKGWLAKAIFFADANKLRNPLVVWWCGIILV